MLVIFFTYMDSLYFTYRLAIKPIEKFSEILNIMIRRIYCLFLLLLFSTNLSWSQNPVNWSLETERIDEKVIELTFTATIEKGWYTYSQFIGDEGPIPTTIEFESTNQRIDKKSTESTSDPSYKFEGFDEMFDMEIIKYKHDFTIKQQLVFDNPDIEIQGYLTYMTCDDTRCLPPTDYEFSFLPSNVKAPNIADQIDTVPTIEQVETSDITTEDVSTTELKPVQWNISYTPLADQQFKIVAQAEIADGWYVYSQENDPNDGPIPTTIFIEDTTDITLISNTESSSNPSYRLSGIDLVFDTELIKYKKQFKIEHVYKVTDTTKTYKGFLEYMTCDDTQCMPPTSLDISFSFLEKVKESTQEKAIYDPAIESLMKTNKMPLGNCDKTENNAIAAIEKVENMNLLAIFFAGFGFGLVALLTPCVFPMIPLTVSYFTKQSKSKSQGIRNASIYGISIIVIYVSLGMLVTLAFGADALNQLSTHWAMNVAFFVLFTIFAFSFFGYYEIQLPSSWTNKADSAANQGGMLGIFFMAFSLSLVSFSCTGPLIGTLLVNAITIGYSGPITGMLGFSVALALPFTLFAAFPGWLNSLPRSGSWMTSVKVVLGFLELALGLKFLSVADLTMHWKILPYEAFIIAWAILFGLMSLYLFGFIRFPHDNPNAKISNARKGIGLASLAFTLYCLSGFMTTKSDTFITPSVLSGLAPPVCYSYIKPCDCPAELTECFHDYYDALEYARKVNKPLLVDFTGYGCVNCRKMEDNVWTVEEVNSLIKDEYVLVSLYVDDREKLPKTLITKEGRKIRNVGNKWAAFQEINFNKQSQPYYVLVNTNEEVMNTPTAYTPDVDTYKAFLECGVSIFNQK